MATTTIISKGSVSKVVIGNQFTMPVIAQDVSIADAGGYYDSDNVEGALQEAGADIVEIFDLLATDTLSFEPVISQTNTPPNTPTSGDRYLVGTSPTGAWVGNANSIAEWNGAAWIFTAPVLNYSVFLTSTATTLKYNGTSWIAGQAVPILQNGNNVGGPVNIGSRSANSLTFLTNSMGRGYVRSTGEFIIGEGFSSAIVPPAIANIVGANSQSGGLAIISTLSRLAIFGANTLDACFKLLQSTGSFIFQRSTGATLATLSESLFDLAVPIKTKQYTSDIQTLSISGGLIAWDMSQGQRAKVTLTGNATLSNPTNVNAAFPDLEVLQNGTGGWVLSFGSNFVLPTSFSAVDTTANSYALYHFQLRSDGKLAVAVTHYTT